MHIDILWCFSDKSKDEGQILKNFYIIPLKFYNSLHIYCQYENKGFYTLWIDQYPA